MQVNNLIRLHNLINQHSRVENQQCLQCAAAVWIHFRSSCRYEYLTLIYFSVYIPRSDK